MATIEITAEQAQIVAALSVARQAKKDAEAAEDAAKEQIAAFAPNIGDVLTLNGLTVAKIVQGSRSGLDPEIVKRRAPGAYRQARTVTKFRTVKIA
jgi:hypothetical protein